MSTEQSESTTRLPAEPAAGGPPPSGPPPEQPAEWGAPPPPAAPKSGWTTKRIVIAVLVAIGIAAAGGVAIYAASGSVDNSQNGPGGGPGGGPRMMAGPMGGFDQAQHGEFQVGDVTALSDDSITVKSQDGYEKTYTIDNDTQKSDNVAKGGQVTVIASTSNGTSTAKSIMELGNFGNRRNGGNVNPPNGNVNPPGGGN
ncbi:hypothetical protein [Actinophytocola sp.]|uniref:hypothetical protein n=1 Tax=Actinophytocola sp. TaxID=1872138 RepID=UPI002D2A26EA|nr:hypothetical protein [Actinophytocola sp.]HYQ65732.1 hypothetical protein [Actinophytocola sp.]